MSSEARRLEEATLRAARDRVASSVVVTVMRAGSYLTRVIERALADAELTLPQFNVLMELAAAPDGVLAMSEVTDRLISTPPSVSWLTGRMRDLGLITKRRSDEDERVVLAAITEAGWEALDEAMPRVFGAEKQLLKGYSRKDMRDTVALLEPLIE